MSVWSGTDIVARTLPAMSISSGRRVLIGAIAIDGQDIAAHRRAVQRRIGYLPENCPLYPDMTVLEHLDYHGALHGIPAAQRPAAIVVRPRDHLVLERSERELEQLPGLYLPRRQPFLGVGRRLGHVVERPRRDIRDRALGA